MSVTFQPADSGDEVAMNVSNVSAVTILRSLGINPDPHGAGLVGEVDPQVILDAIAAMPNDPAVFARDASSSGGPGTGRVLLIECGISEERAASWFRRLYAIADTAKQRGVQVVWN